MWLCSGIATPGPHWAQAQAAMVLGLGIIHVKLIFEHMVSLSTSGQVGLPGYRFQVAHGGQVGQQSLFSYVK